MTVQWSRIAYGRAVVKNCLWSCRGQYLLYDRAVVKNCLWPCREHELLMVMPWPIIAYDRAVIKNCLWPCLGHVLRDSNHSIYYCMICTGYSLLALSFMLEPFMQFGEYIVIKYRGKPQIDMLFSWCGALALDVWKTRACEIMVD